MSKSLSSSSTWNSALWLHYDYLFEDGGFKYAGSSSNPQISFLVPGPKIKQMSANIEWICSNELYEYEQIKLDGYERIELNEYCTNKLNAYERIELT